MTDSARRVCLNCGRNAVCPLDYVRTDAATTADVPVFTLAICTFCGFSLQVDGQVAPSPGPPEEWKPRKRMFDGVRAKMSKRGHELGRTPLNTECDACDHELKRHDFSHVNVKCSELGCSCWGFRLPDEACA